jgi:hypothetical protein
MPKNPRDRVAALMKDVEAHARKLRTDVEKAVATMGLQKKLKVGARKLRKQAAAAAKQLEKHVQQLRKDIQAAMRKQSASRPKTKRRRKPAASR